MHVLIVTFLLKLSSQWVKDALACVYIDLPIGEMKKKVKMSLSIHNLISSRPHSDCLFSSFFYQVSSAMAEENCRKERKGPVQTLIFACTELNTYFGRPKWFEVDSGVELRVQSNSIIFTILMFNCLECFKQVKINFSNLCFSAHEKFDVSTGPNSDDCSRLFYNLKLYFYQEKISLTQKVLAQERKVKIKTSTTVLKTSQL